MVRIVLIGAGNIAKAHAAAYQKMANVQITYVIDAAEEAAYTLCKEFGVTAKVLSSADQILTIDDYDLVDICLPTFLHREFTELFAARGKGVICEKPAALNVTDAEAMFEVCENNQVPLYIGQVCRFMPPYQKLYQRAQETEKGDIYTIHLQRKVRHPGIMQQNWYGHSEKSGGIILDVMIHDLDFIVWSFGLPDSVEAVNAKKGKLFEQVDVVLNYRNGPYIKIEACWTPRPRQPLIQAVQWEDKHLSIVYDNTQPEEWKEVRSKEGIKQEKFPPFSMAEELGHFIDCFQEKKNSFIEKQEVLETLRLALRIRERMEISEG